MSDRSTDVVVSRLAVLTFRRFRVSVVGSAAAAEADASTSELTIGSAAGNQLVLDDPTVSRHHCAIRVTPRGFQLRDLASTNGTWLGNHLVESAYLKPGSTFRVGTVAVKFEFLDDEIRQELSPDDHYGEVLGESPAMRRIFALIARVAPTDSTLLLEGETGTGKSMFADVIHRQSPRAEQPFVVVDCASIPATLIESELFGHEKGAFTGAHAVHVGAFEAANNGTIFLDEVGELPVDLQAKLLRALEERVIKRIGSTKQLRLDVRVIAATNRDLREEVNRGRFRADLYYRLNVLRVRVPPLRERREDIPLLVRHYYRVFVGDDETNPPEALVASLREHSWPGNVRELRSAVERAVLMVDPADGEQATGDGYAGFDETQSFRDAKERAVATWERWYVQELMTRHAGNLTRAARAARMDRAHLRELMQKRGLSRPKGD